MVLMGVIVVNLMDVPLQEDLPIYCMHEGFHEIFLVVFLMVVALYRLDLTIMEFVKHRLFFCCERKVFDRLVKRLLPLDISFDKDQLF